MVAAYCLLSNVVLANSIARDLWRSNELFTDEEQASLTIKRMILHVVGNKDFLAMPERALEEESFFKEKILDTAAAPVFMFKNHSSTKQQLETIANGEATFERGAQALALNFNNKHVGEC